MSYIDDKVFQKALENLKNEFDNKVDKDGNKVLSDNNFTDDLKEKLENEVLVEEDLKDYVKNSDYATDVAAGVVKIGEGLSIDTNGILSADAYSQEEINELLDSKVNIEEGKSLVDDSEIERLATLDNYDDTSILQSIQDLEESKVNKDGDKVLSDNNFTDEFKEKLEKIESEANKYELPKATETVLGGITIGEGLTKDADKNLTVAAATSEKIGGIKLGETLKIDANTGKVNVDSEKVAETFATKEYVDDAIDELPNPMIFQGSVGDGGTVSALPEISEDNIGWTYKAISDGDNYKVGDTLISNGTEWVVIPSGDEPDGTVTNVGLSVPTGFKVKGSPVTSSGNLEFELDEGYELPTTEKFNSYQVKKLITEWGNETSDENYPSEKLVKDSLDKKVDDDSYATTKKAGIVQVGKGLEITDSGLLNITGLETVAISKREYDEEDRSVDNIVYFIEDTDEFSGTNINTLFSAAQLETLNSGITGLDKSKLEGIDFNANKYVLPTASKDIVGGVTTTSEVEDSEGYVACPIIDGVPYYKEGNIVDDGIEIPIASSSTLGGVKTGNNITNTNGTISITSTNITNALGYTPINSNLKGANNGIAELDENGIIPSSQLPSYVDDVIEYDNMEKFPTTGESGRIYIDKNTNKTYRWTGTTYTEISASLALGENSSTAYRGDRGKEAYEHSKSLHARTDATKTESSNTNGNIKINGSEVTVYTHPTGSSSTNPHGTTKSDVGLGNVTNNKQVKGLASGTTSGHIVTWGADGYTVADSGYTIAKSVPSDAKFTDTDTDRYVNSASFSDATSANSASPVKMTLTRAGSDTASVTANIPKVSSSSAGVAPKGAAVSSQTQSTKFLREDGTWAAPSYTTNTNTTYTFATGDSNGQIKVTPSGGSAQNVSVKGLGSAAYTNSTSYVASNDSRLSDSRNAKDVYAWAKASTKPTYTASEVSALPISGGTITGSELKLQHATNETVSVSDKTNPRITFADTDSSQYLSLIYSDYDSYQAPDSLTLVGNQAGSYFIAPNIKATSGLYVSGVARLGADSTVNGKEIASGSRKAGMTVGSGSSVVGYNSTASSDYSFCEGYNSTASGRYSHAEGYNTTASAEDAHAEGYGTTASGLESHAEGQNTTANGTRSHAGGHSSQSSGDQSFAHGHTVVSNNGSSAAFGHHNVSMTTGGTAVNTTGTAFVVGNGTGESAKKNAMSLTYTGVLKTASTMTASTTADYAEFFEWLDGNPDSEDRVGMFVTLDGDKIRIANDEDDYILGIISGEPFVLGNGDCDVWNGMVIRDEYRRTVYEPAPKPIEVIDVNGYPTGETIESETEFFGTRPKLNPDYDSSQPYISRFDRKEWDPVGMLGVLAVNHDGTAKVNGYVTVNKDGIATACERTHENAYRVIKENSPTVVEVIFR